MELSQETNRPDRNSWRPCCEEHCILQLLHILGTQPGYIRATHFPDSVANPFVKDIPGKTRRRKPLGVLFSSGGRDGTPLGKRQKALLYRFPPFGRSRWHMPVPFQAARFVSTHSHAHPDNTWRTQPRLWAFGRFCLLLRIQRVDVRAVIVGGIKVPHSDQHVAKFWEQAKPLTEYCGKWGMGPKPLINNSRALAMCWGC